MRYRFGECELCLDDQQLLVSGKPRPIEPQVFDLLCLLVTQRGRLIARDKLIEVVWSGRPVSDSAISARINAARAAIGDDGARQLWIKTVPRRGFRFTGDVDHLPEQRSAGDNPEDGAPRQRVQFCRSADGTRIAFGTSGSGPPLVKAGHWLTQLDMTGIVRCGDPCWRGLAAATTLPGTTSVETACRTGMSIAFHWTISCRTSRPSWMRQV